MEEKGKERDGLSFGAATPISRGKLGTVVDNVSEIHSTGNVQEPLYFLQLDVISGAASGGTVDCGVR